MKKIKIVKNWNYPKLSTITPNNSLIWGNYQFITEENEAEYDNNYDGLIIFNFSKNELNLNCAKINTLICTQEPPTERYAFFKKRFPDVGHVLTQFVKTDKNIVPHHPCLPWWLGKDLDFLKNLKLDGLDKKSSICWITSNKSFHSGHSARLNFKKEIDSLNLDYNLFGKGFKEIDNKWDVLKNFKYTLAIENSNHKDYWTEKIMDAFLSYTMPIYYGCPNITKYFPKEAIIFIDINKPEEATKIIQEAIKNNLWEKHIDAIKIARNLIIEKYNMFASLSEFMDNNFDFSKKGNVEIPANNWPGLDTNPSYYKKLRHFIKTKIRK
ncbi:glycosyltransferase family 10 domain-containing protein [Polaribacter sp. Asnod1-A03]|uniref:glycosyltransferase family 10 domain-containing protein n=1 Tax=Polaribacter sp. Asnod1-A03 TaxID=3160581 RepID=UPI00386DE0ED